MAYCLDVVAQAHSNCYFRWDDEPSYRPYAGFSRLIPGDPPELPTRATRDRGKQIFDIFGLGGLVAVNAAFRDLVEAFEPDVHLFHPITLREKDGSQVTGDYFIFLARQSADFVLTVESGLNWKDYGAHGPPAPDWMQTSSFESHHPDHKNSKAGRERKFGILASSAARGFEVSYPKHMHASSRPISGLHLWTGQTIFQNQLFVSDDFFRAFEKSKLKYLRSNFFCFERDVPWDTAEQLKPIIDWRRKHVQ
jgi:hypothetical protein